MHRLLLTSLTCVAATAGAWGFDGHRRLAATMQDPLPAGLCLREWFRARQTTALQNRACDPDRFRYATAGVNYDPNEGPRHFLEIDWATPAASYPREFGQAQQLLGPRNALNNGIVPWRVEALYLELVAAFRAADEALILDRAFFLSHYVTDAFSVLHNTKNYDPNGVHSRWESEMLDPIANLNAVNAQAVTLYGTAGVADPKNNIFDVVTVGQTLVPELVAADQETPNDLPAFFARTQELTARRFADAATVMASVLWTAWAEAGRPELSGFSATCSRAAPAGEIVLRGYPVAGGLTHPDGGAPTDAGTAGAGGTSGAGGAGGAGGAATLTPDAGILPEVAGDAGLGGAGGLERPLPAGSGCNAGGVWASVLVVFLDGRRRRGVS